VWLFLQQYKKVIALSVIPVIAVVGLVGFEIKHRQSDDSKPLAVNQEMKALLLEQNDEKSATAAPKVDNSPKVVNPPEVVNSSDDAIKPKVVNSPKATELPAGTAKPLPTPKAGSKSAKTSLLVNMNTANKTELMELSGIGESKANAIIAYREAHPFQTLDELMNVKGIGSKIYAKIKDNLEL
jgi:comEA protein